jgi:choline dehydrogenase-like flavoprotein
MTAALNASVVVVGTGIAGAHLAYTLARKGIDVLMLEAGPRRSRAESLKTFFENPIKGPQAPYPSVASAPHPEDNKYGDFYVQGGPDLSAHLWRHVLALDWFCRSGPSHGSAHAIKLRRRMRLAHRLCHS